MGRMYSINRNGNKTDAKNDDYAFFKPLFILLFVFNLVACSAPGLEGKFEATSVKGSSYAVLELRDGTKPIYVLGILNNEDISLTTTISLEKGISQRPTKNYVAALQYRNSFEIWKTIAEFQNIAFDNELTFSLNASEIEPGSTSIRVAVWELGKTTTTPLFKSKTTKLQIWTIYTYFNAFNELRNEVNNQLESEYKLAGQECRKAVKAHGNTETSAVNCMQALGRMYEKGFNFNDTYYTQIFTLGIPQPLHDEVIDYLEAALNLDNFIAQEIYPYCLDSVYSDASAVICTEQSAEISSRRKTLELDFSRAKDNLAEKFISLGAPDFRLTD